MSTQLAEEITALKIKEDSCSRCSICSSLCPFEALRKHPRFCGGREAIWSGKIYPTEEAEKS